MNKVCGGIVAYNPDSDRFVDVVNSIANQVDVLVIVNNGTKNFADILDKLSFIKNLSVINNIENEGIAKALNQICDYAKRNNYQWALTLDQDTVCPSNLVTNLGSSTVGSNLGIVCPAVRYEGMDLTTKHIDGGVQTEEVKGCMTSASLTNLEAWSEVGGFKEEYFIDYVDNEFCMKLQLAGYRILRVNNCAISHQLGNAVEKRFFWKKIKGSSHSPVRIYYMIRNNLLFIKEYKSQLNVFKEYVKVFYIFSCELFFGESKKNVIQYAWKGLSDALKCKTGRIR